MTSLLKSKYPHLYLKPGELFLSRRPAIVSTLLGSCVSLTFHSRAARLGAMCHVLLPYGAIEQGFKYLDSTLGFMVDRIEGMGIRAASCEVKLFGGADVLFSSGIAGNRLSIGSQNILAAESLLDSLGIVPKISDVGGQCGRKLIFNSVTGDVFLRKVLKSS